MTPTAGEVCARVVRRIAKCFVVNLFSAIWGLHTHWSSPSGHQALLVLCCSSCPLPLPPPHPLCAFKVHPFFAPHAVLFFRRIQYVLRSITCLEWNHLNPRWLSGPPLAILIVGWPSFFSVSPAVRISFVFWDYRAKKTLLCQLKAKCLKVCIGKKEQRFSAHLKGN